MAMQIAVKIEDYFGILFNLRGLFENPSVEDISNKIKELLVEKSTANGI